MSADSERLQELIGREVVLDVTSPYVYVGRLVKQDDRFFLLQDADVHDLRDTTTTRELYVLESKRHGTRSNRKSVLIRCEEVISISALDDVVE